MLEPPPPGISVPVSMYTLRCQRDVKLQKKKRRNTNELHSVLISMNILITFADMKPTGPIVDILLLTLDNRHNIVLDLDLVSGSG